VPLGTLAERAGVPHVVLTHLIPPPTTDDEEAAFSSDLRDGGYTGQITVGRDLTTVEVDNPRSGR
jgi:ribonuclease Z